MTDHYAVMGNPIAHSKSPAIHAMFAAQTGQDMGYAAILVPKDGFAVAVDEFRRQGGKGLNVTVPFKQQAWTIAERRSDRAGKAGAVNTLTIRDDGSLCGDNTDGAGLVRDLTVNRGVELAGTRILVLGAGGAVRGVLAPLIAAGPSELVIANRTVAKARELADLFADDFPVQADGYEQLRGRSFDLIINGTSTGISGELPPVPVGVIGGDAVGYDMFYADEPTAFVRWVRRHGARAAYDGLGMLVEQAAESFYLWRGIRPETGPVISALRDA